MTDKNTIPAPAAPKTVTITLNDPITLNNGEMKEFTIRHPVAGDMRNGLNSPSLFQGDFDQIRILLPRICISSPPIIAEMIDQMSFRDLAQVTGELMSFFMTEQDLDQVKKMQSGQ